jgi:hypothetical protein
VRREEDTVHLLTDQVHSISQLTTSVKSVPSRKLNPILRQTKTRLLNEQITTWHGRLLTYPARSSQGLVEFGLWKLIGEFRICDPEAASRIAHSPDFNHMMPCRIFWLLPTSDTGCFHPAPWSSRFLDSPGSGVISKRWNCLGLSNSLELSPPPDNPQDRNPRNVGDIQTNPRLNQIVCNENPARRAAPFPVLLLFSPVASFRQLSACLMVCPAYLQYGVHQMMYYYYCPP